MERQKTFREEYATKLLLRLTEKQKSKRTIPKYMKPKIIKEVGQFPFRCPICWEKHIYENQTAECLDECWNIIATMVWQVEEPAKEIDNYQWDLNVGGWAGVVWYSNGCIKYFRHEGHIEYITIEELISLLEKGYNIHNKSTRTLPDKRLKVFDTEIIKKPLQEPIRLHEMFDDKRSEPPRHECASHPSPEGVGGGASTGDGNK